MSDDEADLQYVRRSKVVHYGALDEQGVPAENSDQLQNETTNVQVFFGAMQILLQLSDLGVENNLKTMH